MKHFYSYIFGLVSFALLSCNNEEKSLGEVSYYPSFLWSDSSIVPVEKTMFFDFSQDAINDPKTFVELQFTDNDHHVISTKDMQVSVDGQPLNENKFRVDSKTKSLNLSFIFTPEAKKGKHQGVLLLVNHDIDRLDAQTLSPGQQVEVFQWTLNYKKTMNPLAKGLMWLLIILLSALLLWFLLLKWMFFPTFRGVHNLQVVEPYFSSKHLSGKRLLILCAERPKKPQSTINKLFTGEIVYECNPIWGTPLEVRPSKRTAHVATKPGYLILAADGHSLPTKWVAGGEYNIEILDSKEKVRILII